MDYTLRELECFTAVAEELSFTRAARRLHLAQPPLSRHIQSLEGKIGAALFERSRRLVTLTPAGHVFFEESRGLLAQLVRAGESARRSGQGEVARLRLGFVSAVLSPALVDTFREFRTAFPTVQIRLLDSPPAEQLAGIDRGELDGGFIGLAPSDRPKRVQLIPWQTEELGLFVPSGHPWAGRKQIALREVAREPFVAVSSEAAPAFALHVRELCRQASFRPRVVVEASRAQAVAVMVAAGSGVALLPRALARVVGSSAAVLPLHPPALITHVFAHAGRPSGPMAGLVQLLRKA
jgi:DNA-binding transcriptional LysR family regulator